jgi:cytidine diphosphoramidate kinase
MVLWIIGLSGAGKTTLGRAVMKSVPTGRTVFIDGDLIRQVFGNDLGFTLAEREQNAWRICRLCKFLDDQGINVVCAILSLFPETQSWNRQNYRDYFEVFIDAPLEQLIARDVKGLYKKALSGEITDVAGVDLEFTHPPHPDLIVANNGSEAELLAHAAALSAKLK